MAEVKLTGKFLNRVTDNPRWGALFITPVGDPFADTAADIVYSGSAEVPLDEVGEFGQEMPEGDYEIRFSFRPGPIPAPITVTLLTATSTEIIEDDGAGGTFTRYEKDISDFF